MRSIPKPKKQLAKLIKGGKSHQVQNLIPKHPSLSKFRMLNAHLSNQNITEQNSCHNGKTLCLET